MTAMRIQLVPRPGQPDFLDLPWDEPLEEWQSERLAVVERGISRHVVRFVEYDGTFYALKEINHELAHREYRLLRALAHDGMPVVDAVGIVHRPNLQDILITRHLEYSLPYRIMFARKPVAGPARPPDQRAREPARAAAPRRVLLGRLLALEHALPPRRAQLAAYVVDVETGELHDQLSDGQRLHDLDVAQENIVGELLDLEAELGDLDIDDPFELATEVAAEYERIWNELMAEEDFRADERDRLQERLKRLNERGFDVEEVELEATDDGYRLRIRPQVVEAGHYRRRLLKLTGLEAQENQARRLLEDIESFRASLKASGQEPVSDTAAAARWLTDVFEPTVVRAIPEDLHGKRAAAQVFHELLEHRWHLSEQAGRDVGMDEAVDSYVENVLRAAPEERVIVEEN